MLFKFKVRNQLDHTGVTLFAYKQDKNSEKTIHDWHVITADIDTKENRAKARKLAKSLNEAFEKFKINEAVEFAFKHIESQVELTEFVHGQLTSQRAQKETTDKQPTMGGMKRCPKCKRLYHAFNKVCPHCKKEKVK